MEGDWAIFVHAGDSMGTQVALHGCADWEGLYLGQAV